MEVQSNIFEQFARRRQTLNDNLDESRRAIDAWFERQPMPAPMTALANLEVLLKDRRELLEQLIKLDNEFMERLIQLRAEGPDPG